MSGLLASKAAALASKSLAWGERQLQQRNEQAREREQILEDLTSLDRLEAQAKAELQTWKSREMQLQGELGSLKRLTKDVNRNTETLNKGTSKLNKGINRLKVALESFEKELSNG